MASESWTKRSETGEWRLRPMPARHLLDWHRECGTHRPSQSAEAELTRLAKLLLVEERLQACQEPVAASRQCNVTADIEAAGNGGLLQWSNDMSCGACQLRRFRAEVNAIYVGDRKRVAEKDALIHAATLHGVRSNAYRQARRELSAAA